MGSPVFVKAKNQRKRGCLLEETASEDVVWLLPRTGGAVAAAGGRTDTCHNGRRSASC